MTTTLDRDNNKVHHRRQVRAPSAHAGWLDEGGLVGGGHTRTQSQPRYLLGVFRVSLHGQGTVSKACVCVCVRADNRNIFFVCLLMARLHIHIIIVLYVGADAFGR